MLDWILTKDGKRLIQAIVDISNSLKELVEIAKTK